MLFRRITNIPGVQTLLALSQRITLPGFDGYSLYEVLRFFVRRLLEGEVQTRAHSIAFSFFLALFPALIFLFTLIPYIPVEGFQDRLMLTLRGVMPPNTYEASRSTIEDIVTRPRSGLLSLGLLFALYISSGGVLTLISVFNARSHHKSPSAWRLRVKSVWLTLYLVLLFLVAVGLLILSEFAFFYLREKVELTSRAPLFLLAAGKWLLLVALCLTAISSLYFFGTHKLSRWRFISAGSTLATILIIVTSLGFNYFIEHFSQYNKLYGSIGTLIVILLWIDFNCLQLIIGFELNASIEQARLKSRKTLKVVTG
jgi:membrane protein